MYYIVENFTRICSYLKESIFNPSYENYLVYLCQDSTKTYTIAHNTAEEEFYKQLGYVPVTADEYYDALKKENTNDRYLRITY